MKKPLLRALLIAAAVLALAAAFDFLHVLRPLEWKSWDFRLRLFSRPEQADPDIVIVLVDQQSLDVYEKEMGLGWPWPRQMYSPLVRYCRQAGAKALFFDMIFSEKSSWEGDDEDLAGAMKEAGNVFLPVFLSSEEREPDEAALSALEPFSVQALHHPRAAVFPMRSASLPVPVLLSAASGAGNVRFVADGDGIYRRIPLLFELRGLTLPGLPLALEAYVSGRTSPLDFPVDRSGQMIVRYHGPQGTYKAYSAAAVINSFVQTEQGETPQIPARELSGKIVLFGTSAPGLLDLRSTPLSSVCPGVEIQAAVLDNLLNRDFVRVVPKAVSLVLLALFILITAVGTSYAGKIWTIVLVFVAGLAVPAAAAGLGLAVGYWVDFALPVFGVLAAFIASALLKYSLEGRQRRFIKSVFRYYLSPHVIDNILRNPDLLRLGGERREITSFFSDLAGFTSISESLSPEDLVSLLNLYLSEMTDIILASGGTLDKYEGDAIIAFWNAPVDQPDHALRACRAALACQQRLREKGREFGDKFGRELSMRIGLNSGPAVVGNMGSRERFDYTAMGDTVNLASRLEGACKVYGVPILVGEETFDRIRGQVLGREVDTIRVVGKRQAVRVFTILGELATAGPEQKAAVETFHRALELFRKRNWDEAESLFRQLGEDRLSMMYLKRIEELRASPPPEGWDGVFELKEK